MNIRPYKKGDESQIVWLINNTWKTAYSHIFPSEVFEERERNINERISVFGENLEKFERICFVAEENSKIVGVLVGILNSNIEQFDENGYARINILYIDKEFQHCWSILPDILHHFHHQKYIHYLVNKLQCT